MACWRTLTGKLGATWPYLLRNMGLTHQIYMGIQQTRMVNKNIKRGEISTNTCEAYSVNFKLTSNTHDGDGVFNGVYIYIYCYIYI